MNLRQIVEKSNDKVGKLPATVTSLAKASREAKTAVENLRGDTRTAQGKLRTELDLIPPVVTSVQKTLRDGQKKVLDRLVSCENEVTQLKTLMQQAQIDLTQAISNLRTNANTLNSALPDAQTKLNTLVEAQREQWDQDCTAEETAHDALRETLKKAQNTVERLTEQGKTATQDATASVKSATDALAAISSQLVKYRETLLDDTSTVATNYHTALTATQVETVKPTSEKIAADLRTGLQQQVAKPAQDAVEALALASEALGEQMQKHEQEVGPFRQKLDKTFKEMQAGPQLIPLANASKHVLKKVGKLNF